MTTRKVVDMTSLPEELGKTLRWARTVRGRVPRSGVEIARAINREAPVSNETIRRLEAGEEWPPFRHLVTKVLPACGLGLAEWHQSLLGKQPRAPLGAFRRNPDRSSLESELVFIVSDDDDCERECGW